MPIRQSSFAETGAASSFKNRVENHSGGITDLPGVEHMGDMTPFQNQVLDAAEKKEQEEKEKQRKEARENAGSGNSEPTRNARSGGSSNSDLGRTETVRYVNKQENPDSDSH